MDESIRCEVGDKVRAKAHTIENHWSMRVESITPDTVGTVERVYRRASNLPANLTIRFSGSVGTYDLYEGEVDKYTPAAQQADAGQGEDRYLIQRKELDAYKRALKDMIAAYDEVTSEYGE